CSAAPRDARISVRRTGVATVPRGPKTRTAKTQNVTTRPTPDPKAGPGSPARSTGARVGTRPPRRTGGQAAARRRARRTSVVAGVGTPPGGWGGGPPAQAGARWGGGRGRGA